MLGVYEIYFLILDLDFIFRRYFVMCEKFLKFEEF